MQSAHLIEAYPNHSQRGKLQISQHNNCLFVFIFVFLFLFVCFVSFCSTSYACTFEYIMFIEFRRCIPTLSAWMESCYSCQPLLLLGNKSIHSCCGVQQGDPLGPLGFALTLHSIIERIKAEVPGLALNAWYLDDGPSLVPQMTSLLLSILLREMVLLLGSPSTEANPSSLSQRRLKPHALPFHQISPPLAEASLSWVAPLVPPTYVRKSFRTGLLR